MLTKDLKQRLIIAESIVNNSKESWTKNPIIHGNSQKLSHRSTSTTRKNILNAYGDREISEKKKIQLGKQLLTPDYSPYVYEKNAKTIQTDEQYERQMNSIR